MMTAPHFFGNSYPAYHRPSIDSLQARESPLDLQINSKQRNCESQPLPLPTPSPATSPRLVAYNRFSWHIHEPMIPRKRSGKKNSNHIIDCNNISKWFFNQNMSLKLFEEDAESSAPVQLYTLICNGQCMSICIVVSYDLIL